MRLDKGLEETEIFLENFIKLNEERLDSLKNIIGVANSLSSPGLNFTQSAEVLDPQAGNLNNNVNESNNKKVFDSNMEIFFNLYDKNKNYTKTVSVNIKEQLLLYRADVTELKEIFLRLDEIEEKIRNLSNSNGKNKTK